MNFWIGFWTVLLIGAVISLAGLAVVVTIGGFFDVKAMFKSIAESHEHEQQEQREVP